MSNLFSGAPGTEMRAIWRYASSSRCAAAMLLETASEITLSAIAVNQRRERSMSCDLRYPWLGQSCAERRPVSHLTGPRQTPAVRMPSQQASISREEGPPFSCHRAAALLALRHARRRGKQTSAEMRSHFVPYPLRHDSVRVAHLRSTM